MIVIPMHRLAGLLVLLCAWPAAADAPKMKFNDVKQIAPGVFFRYSSISPTDMSIFGGSNNIWVVFEEYVVVIDANFPKEAEDVLAAIRKTTISPSEETSRRFLKKPAGNFVERVKVSIR